MYRSNNTKPIKEVEIICQRTRYRYSAYKKKIVRPTFFLSIDVDSITPTVEDEYQIGPERKDLQNRHHKRYTSYVFDLDNRYWIWEWRKNYDDIKESKVYLVYRQIVEYLDKLSERPVENFNLITASFTHTDKELSPAMYQPAIDQLQNFAREIHCFKASNDRDRIFIEVSIMFNNEQLRRHKVLNKLYVKFRLFFYGRIIDAESFKIYVGTAQDVNPYFTFDNIHIADYGIEEDNIHGDADLPISKERFVSTYFADQYHPVVFINISNHAMAEKGNNSTF